MVFMVHGIRKIESKEEIETREKRRTRMLVALTLLLLLGSTAGYAFLSSEKSSNVGDSGTSGVQNVGGQWMINYNGEILVFSNPPNVTKQTEINISYDISSYSQKPVYVAGNNSIALYEIASTLGRYATRFQEACYWNCSLDLPQKTCGDLIIIVNGTGQNNVYQKDNCIFINGNLSTVDAFLYRVFGLA